jgi:hypothetical protein
VDPVRVLPGAGDDGGSRRGGGGRRVERSGQPEAVLPAMQSLAWREAWERTTEAEVSERVRQHLAGEPEPEDVTYPCPPCAGTGQLESSDWWDCRRCGGTGRLKDRRNPVRVGSEREGWRARLANVERLLTEATVEDIVVTDGGLVREVRSMIDGDETTGAP